MAQFNAENERIKRQYLNWMKEADGKDEATLDQVASTLSDVEKALGWKPFKSFHRDWARRYKTHLERCKTARTGRALSLTTRDARLRQTKAFFKWLASQPGYRSRISFSDVEYFNNAAKDARAAHARRPMAYPSLEQCAHAFRLMPEETETDCRDRAIFAALVLTGARDGALASLRLAHVDLVEGKIVQDGREVRTKGGKSFETWFFPVDEMYRGTFCGWVRHLREDRLYGPADALFPKSTIARTSAGFSNIGLSREPFASAQAIRDVVKTAFSRAGLQPYTPHTFRKTLAFLGDRTCQTMEARKAWSQNLGHEHLATTVTAYMPVAPERQRELIRALAHDRRQAEVRAP